MISHLSRACLALIVVLALAACASSSAPTWTYAPPTPSPSAGPSTEASAAPSTAATARPSLAPSSAPTEAPASGSPTGSPGGSPGAEARVIEIEATVDLLFKQDGTQITDIPVTPGETVLFRVDNTAGFTHNFQIATDAELGQPGASGLPGIQTWESGVREYEWTVPESVEGLKFGCTIAGHYQRMQGTFSVQ